MLPKTPESAAVAPTPWGDRLRRSVACWAGRGLDLLFPPQCLVCGAETGGCDAAAGDVGSHAGQSVCAACERELAADAARCLGCGDLLPAGSPSAGACGRCRGGRAASRPGEGIVVLGPYADRLREVVLRGKRPAGDGASRALALLLVAKHRAIFAAWRPDGVVPVPMHWLRRALRGTSAADVLAATVAASLGLPLVRALGRCTATRMQNELPPDERPANVRSAFAVRRAVRGRRLLLVDDVVTTGATLSACRRMLVEAGATAVFACAVARAERSPPTGFTDGAGA